jgi:hypothetical protein
MSRVSNGRSLPIFFVDRNGADTSVVKRCLTEHRKFLANHGNRE